MKRRDTQKELLAARAELSGLARKTHRCIGKVARHAYEQLGALPLAGESNISAWTEPDSIFGLEEIRLHWPAEGPPVRLPGKPGYVVLRAETQRHDTKISGKAVVGVDVEVSDHLIEDGDRFTITSNGTAFAFAFDEYSYVYPLEPRRQVRGTSNLGTRTYGQYYNTVQEVRDDHASNYTGALAVTGLVVASIDAAYGVHVETGGLESLLEAWRDVGITEHGNMDARLAAFLPPDLALQAGVAF